MDEELRNLEMQALVDPEARLQLTQYKLRIGLPLSLEENRLWHEFINKQILDLNQANKEVTKRFLLTMGDTLEAEIRNFYDNYPITRIYLQFLIDGGETYWNQVLHEISEGGERLDVLIDLRHSISGAPFCIGIGPCSWLDQPGNCHYQAEEPHLILETGTNLDPRHLEIIGQSPELKRLQLEVVKFLQNLVKTDLALGLCYWGRKQANRERTGGGGDAAALEFDRKRLTAFANDSELRSVKKSYTSLNLKPADIKKIGLEL